MQVTSSLSFEQADRSWRKIVVTIGYHDLLKLVNEGKVPGYKVLFAQKADGSFSDDAVIADEAGVPLPLNEEYKVLMRHADTLVIAQTAKEGHITVEEARRQIAELG